MTSDGSLWTVILVGRLGILERACACTSGVVSTGLLVVCEVARLATLETKGGVVDFAHGEEVDHGEDGLGKDVHCRAGTRWFEQSRN